ncbi:type ISP restriction/modification enzyme [Helicobacter sp. T3_23-1059]
MQTYILDYHNTLQSLINRGDANEHSFRTALENLLNASKPTQAAQSQSSEQGEIVIIHEPKSKQGQGSIRPDFKVVHKMPQDSKTQIPQEKVGYESLVGFIECKNYGVDLSPLVKGKQIEKYLSVCHNIILTDYNRFILLSYGKIIDDLVLFPNGVESNLLNATQDKATQKTKLIESTTRISQLLSEFFHTTAQITQKDELVKVLSTQSFYLSTAIFNEFSTQDLESNATNLLTATTQTSTTTDFHAAFDKSYQSFRDLESADISEIEFCDIVAQSIVYGAFVAHIESEIYEIDKIPTEMFVALLPKHFVTLREFIESSLPARNLPDSIAYALSNIIKTIALIDKPSLATSFQKEIGELSIYLYEDFLRAYDELRGEQKRKEGGVFYTPEPIVNMIVRSIDELLQTHFGKTFSDESVKVLDFATGTGSFLAKVFELILQNQSEVFAKNVIINKCFRDIYGFEMSFVPYIVAHLKLSSLLRAQGFSEFSAHQKFQVYLTNTLDLDMGRQIYLQVPFDTLKNERDKSLQLKHKEDLLVILGNPPYNVKSKNKHKEILTLLDSYKMGLNEQNIQPLDDDYIKFIRFAQWKLTEQNKNHGIMGFITNNSYLYGRTHRKMRESLAKTFDEIYILNLHGHNEIDGKNDKNVFDIRVGVCISLFVKYDTHPLAPSAREGEQEKYYFAMDGEQESVLKSPLPCGGDLGVGHSSLRDLATPNRSNPKNPSLAHSYSESSTSIAEGDKGGGYNLAQIHYFSTKDNEILRRKDKFALLNKIADKGLKSIKWKKLKLDSPYFWFVPKSFKSNEYNKFWALAKNESLGESKAIFKNFNSGIKTEKDKICIHFNKQNVVNIVNDFVKLEIEAIRQKYQLGKDSRDWSIERAKAEVASTLVPPPLRRGLGGGYENLKHRTLAPYMKDFSRQMRKNPTDAENKLWQELRGKKLGFGFRRQFVIDSKYIANFVCLEKRLIIECDGGQHNQTELPHPKPLPQGEGLTFDSPSLAEGDKGGGYEKINHSDIQRDFYLESQNFRILRFWNNEILENLEGVLCVIKEALEADFVLPKSTHPLAPSAREGEQERCDFAMEGEQRANPFAREGEQNGKSKSPFPCGGDLGVGNPSLRESEANAAIHKNTPPQTPPARGGAFSVSPSLARVDSLKSSPSLAEGVRGWVEKIQKIAYRPFDIRYTFTSGKTKGFLGYPRFETMKHFLMGENLGICFTKDCELSVYDNAIISNKPTDIHYNGGQTYIAPLYTYPDEFLQGDKTPNFTQEFSDFIAKHKVLKSKSPEQILAFIYGNLYNPAYRAKYLEYLKIGFPRVDFEVSQSQFERFANLGQNLIDLHLMKTIPQDKSIDLVFRANANKSNPNFTLDKPKYEQNQNKIILNADLEIVGVSAEVWDYTIGGYKVLEKWLKYRANDKNGAIMLEQSDFTHILNVAKILKATITIQAELANIK